MATKATRPGFPIKAAAIIEETPMRSRRAAMLSALTAAPLALALLTLPAALTLSATPAQAQTKVKIMVGGIDKQIYLPAKLADQLGYFKEQGLDVELFSTTSGQAAATALLAREVAGVVGFYDHTIDLQSKGKFITDVVQFGIAPGETVLVKADEAEKYGNPANWKGQPLGVTGLGSATDFLTRFLASRAGLKNQDYTLVPVGAGDTFLAAIQQGKIVSGMTTEPTDYMAGDRALYVKGLADGKAQYSPDGMMPNGAPESVLKVLQAFSPSVQGKTIDLAKTFTTEFVVKANATN